MDDHATTAHLRHLDQEFVWHPFTPMKPWLEGEPLVITDAQGMHLIDSDGNRYLDGVASLWCNVHGHRVPEIDAAIRKQLERVAHTTLLGLANEPATLLAEKLVRMVPAGLTKIFYSDSGATATEIAFKMAAQYWHNIGKPQKSGFVGLEAAYHGDTVGAMSVGREEAFHRPFASMLFPAHFALSPDVYHSELPDDPEAVKRMALLSLKGILAEHGPNLAAVCVEPVVQGAGGIIVQPAGYLADVRSLCDEFDVLLIADEVATGFGRTERMFACEHESVCPDLLCVGKGITGGYLPLAATFATQRIFDAFLGEPSEGKTFFHGHTYTGNPLACAAALASLELLHKNKLLDSIRHKSKLLAEMLKELRGLPHVGDIRHKGMMVGIELVADKAKRQPFEASRRMGAHVCTKIRKHGVILRPLGDVIVLMPPLAMPASDLRTIIDAVKTEVAALSPA